MSPVPSYDPGHTPDDEAYWEAVYREEDPPRWNLGEAAPPIARYLEGQDPALVAPGRVLVPGCGFGHEVELLARLGFDPVGVDMAPSAIREAGKRLRTAGIDAELWQTDLFELGRDPALAGTFDGVIEHTCFCAIRPERRAEYAATMAHLLRNGGVLLGVFYNHGQPDGPPFDTTEAEVRATFAAPHWDLEFIAPAANSIERRAGKELLTVLRRR